MDATPGRRWPDESQLPPFQWEPGDPINSLQAWEAAEEAGVITPDAVLVRLRRIAVREFGDTGPAGYDEDGFIVSLVAEGIREGNLILDIHTDDHPPPHVHIKRPQDKGSHGVIINLVTGEVDTKRLPRDVRSKDLRKMSELVAKNHTHLAKLWEKNHGTHVAPLEACTLPD